MAGSVGQTLENIGPVALKRIASSYSKWVDRNNGVEDKQQVSYAEYMNNFDTVKSLESRQIKLRAAIGKMENTLEDMSKNMKNLCDRLKAVEPKEEDLRTPKTEEELDAVRNTIHGFNKKNHRMKKSNEGVVWGGEKKYSVIVHKSSLVSWLESPHAKEYGLDPSVVEDFAVCVHKGKLVTLDRSYKDGIGIEALWVPQETMNKRRGPAIGWKNDECYKKDPRRKFSFKGARWVPEEDSEVTLGKRKAI